MRLRPALVAASLLGWSLASIVALAQPKRAAKVAVGRGAAGKPGSYDRAGKSGAGKADSGKSDTPDRQDTKAESAATPVVQASDDIGGPPAAPAASRENKLSPLNPEANEFADGGVPVPAPAADYDRLLGDIAALQGRVSALTATLFASKLRVVIEAQGVDARVASFSVSLDGGVVFTAPDRFVADEERTVYEHSVAPGHHVLGLEIERVDTRNAEYRTWQSSRFSLVVPERKLIDARLLIQDDSGMAKDFPADQDGEYDLRVRLRARVTP